MDQKEMQRSVKINIKDTGLRIKHLRKDQNFTQEVLSEMAGITPHYLYEIESGRKSMSIHILASIASALQVSADYLLFGNDSRLFDVDMPSEHKQLMELTTRLTSSQKKHVLEILNVMIPYLKRD